MQYRTDSLQPQHTEALSTRGVLQELAREFAGIDDIRILEQSQRQNGQRDKVFVILATHNVRRDHSIVEVLCQLDVDMDLVPLVSEGMVPSEATSILH